MYKRTSDYLAWDRVVLVALHVEDSAPGIGDPSVSAKLIHVDAEGTTYGSVDWAHSPQMPNEGYSAKTLKLLQELTESIEEDFGRKAFQRVEKVGSESSGPETQEGLSAGLGGSK